MQPRLAFLANAVLVIAFCLPGQSLSAGSDVMSFSTAWEQVKSVDGALAAGRSNMNRSIALREAVRGQRYPRIDLNGVYTRLNDPVELDALRFNPLAGIADDSLGQDLIELLGGPENFRTQLSENDIARVDLTTLWPLYTGGRIRAEEDLAEAGIVVSKQTLELEQRVLFQELLEAYFAVPLARQVLVARQAAEKDLAKHLSDANALEREGVIARVSRVAVSAAHSRAQVERERAGRALDLAKSRFTRLLQSESALMPLDPLFVNQTLPPLERFMDPAISSSPLIVQLEARRREAEAVLSAQRGRYHPEVYLFGGYTVYEDDSILADLAPDWQVGIGMTITLVDRLGRADSIRAAQFASDAVAHLERDVEQQIGLTVEFLHSEAAQAQSTYEGLEVSLELAEETLHLQRQAFVQGFATAVELVDAQLLLVAVETERAAAAFAYVMSLGRLLAISGQTAQFIEYQARGQAIDLLEGQSSE